MIELELMCSWLDIDGYRIGYASQTYEGAWTHTGGQEDGQVIPDPNVSIWHGVVSPVTFAALEADTNVAILWNEEVIEDGE